MPKRRMAAPTNTTHRVCVRGASAMTGSPRAATTGHHEPPGTWIGAGGTAGGAFIGPWRSVRQRGSRLSTVGITEKVYGGGGEGVPPSSGAPPPGSVDAGAPRGRPRHKVTPKITDHNRVTERAIR